MVASWITVALGFVQLLVTSVDPALEDVKHGMRARLRQLSQLEIKFESRAYRFEDDVDPWDEDAWEPMRGSLCMDMFGTLKILAPSSFWVDVKSSCPGEMRHDRYGWHEGELRMLGGLESSNLGGTIKDEHIGGLLFTEHVFTPLEFRFFERRETLHELFAAFSMAIVEDSADGDPSICTVRGEETQGPSARIASVTLDRSRGYIPTEMHYRVEAQGKMIYEFGYRLLESSLHDGLVLPARAAYYVHNPQVMRKYTLTEWRLVTARHDPIISPDTIVLDFPAGSHVFDLIRREEWMVGQGGERLNVQSVPDELETSLQANIDANVRADELRASRRRLFPYVGGGAAILTLGILAFRWFRSSHV